MKTISSNNKLFNLNRTAIMAGIISATFSLHAIASAGRVEFALGGATILRGDGSASQAIKGDDINPGDTIKTTDGRVQVRFTDGGYMSFQPNTEFKVEDYSYTGKTDGTEKAFFRLIEGGLRAITGVVGHANKPNYKVSTPVATIGIRGSEYLAEYRGKLMAHCNHGSIFVFNDKGNLILFRGQTAVVGSGAPSYGDNTEGVGARGPSNTNTAYNEQNKGQDQNNTYRGGEIRNEDGSLASIVTVKNADGAAFAYAGDGGEGVFTPLSYDFGYENQTETSSFNFDSAGNFVKAELKYTYNEPSNNYTAIGTDTVTASAGAQTLDKGSVGALSWFRVSGTVTEQESYDYTYNGSGPYHVDGSSSTYNNPHFIYGTPTSLSDLASLNSDVASISGYNATYNLVGGTSPVDTQGNTGKLNSGSLNVDFGQQHLTGNLNLTMNGGAAAGTYDANFNGSLGSISGGTLTGTFSAGGSANGGPSGGYINLSGFFAGSRAAQAGLSYNLDAYGTGTQINGTAAFTKTSQSANLPPQ
ncbi:FecR family protein [Methyloradius palustris]|uniref:FecR protein domain-containing protein n=1 Tax=Methyloradius palustris TaxID=2778876 RepID=A0A8D5JQT5_9PROT|nr:FecR family protein [Methyloradius palustris]BCM24791.1 hypothetical protein ZMTM_10500 [Methyloradius palustris]